ncbi:MAG: hypothetical protein IKF82_07745 [Bacilli bacterium]|nr:hypothetical protein [Bacilli bacterium]
MLNFNDEHKLTSVGKKVENSSLNDFSKMVNMMGFAVLLSSSLSACGSAERSRVVEVQNNMQEAVERTIGDDDLDILATAERVDYSETAKYFLDDNSIFYDELEEGIEISEFDNSIPSYEDFKESMERTLTNYDYMLRKIRVAQISEEEKNKFFDEMYSDYIVITRYLNNNEKADYDKLFDEGLKYKFGELLELHDAYAFQLNNIQFMTEVNEETQEEEGYAILDVEVNGKNIRFEARNRLYDILVDRYGTGVSSYQIETLLSHESLTDLNAETINAFNYPTDSIVFCMLATLVCGYIICDSVMHIFDARQKNKQKK